MVGLASGCVSAGRKEWAAGLRSKSVPRPSVKTARQGPGRLSLLPALPPPSPLAEDEPSSVEERSCFLCLVWAFSLKFSLRQKFGKASLRKAASRRTTWGAAIGATAHRPAGAASQGRDQLHRLLPLNLVKEVFKKKKKKKN